MNKLTKKNVENENNLERFKKNILLKILFFLIVFINHKYTKSKCQMQKMKNCDVQMHYFEKYWNTTKIIKYILYLKIYFLKSKVIYYVKLNNQQILFFTKINLTLQIFEKQNIVNINNVKFFKNY